MAESTQAHRPRWRVEVGQRALLLWSWSLVEAIPETRRRFFVGGIEPAHERVVADGTTLTHRGAVRAATQAARAIERTEASRRSYSIPTGREAACRQEDPETTWQTHPGATYPFKGDRVTLTRGAATVVDIVTDAELVDGDVILSTAEARGDWGDGKFWIAPDGWTLTKTESLVSPGSERRDAEPQLELHEWLHRKERA